MPVGQSGRILVEFDPELKRRPHARLRSEGRDFKSWLLERVQEYLDAPRATSWTPPRREEPPSGLTEVERRVLDAVSSDALARQHVDQLAEATSLGVREVQLALLQLELLGHVVHHFGFYRCVRPS